MRYSVWMTPIQRRRSDGCGEGAFSVAASTYSAALHSPVQAGIPNTKAIKKRRTRFSHVQRDLIEDARADNNEIWNAFDATLITL